MYFLVWYIVTVTILKSLFNLLRFTTIYFSLEVAFEVPVIWRKGGSLFFFFWRGPMMVSGKSGLDWARLWTELDLFLRG